MNEAIRLVKKIRKKNANLRDLTALEYEHLAVGLYGPGAKWGNLKKQYYTVTGGSSPQWVINTAGNQRLVTYVNSVYGNLNTNPQ